jgi:hypothetical protein
MDCCQINRCPRKKTPTHHLVHCVRAWRS